MNNKPFQRMANVDGRITPAEEAKISIFDRGFLYGDSVYEVFRTYSGVGLFVDEHFDRLENSARLIHMPISQSRDMLLEEIHRTSQQQRAQQQRATQPELRADKTCISAITTRVA